MGASAQTAAQQETTYVTRLLREDLANYLDMLDGRDPLEIEDLGATASTRMTFEPLVMQVAPVLGGCNCRVVYEPYDVHTPHARTIEQVRAGRELTHGVAGFSDDSRYAEGIWLSEPILDRQDFYVGFYTLEERTDVLAVTDFAEIRNLRFGVTRTWELDRDVIAQYGFREQTADSWPTILRMIAAGRADVVLQPFAASSDDLSFEDVANGARLKPIPGMRLLFGQGRHFIVSQNHPDGAEFLKALNRGIGILRDQGVLRRGMAHAGVIAPQTESFEIFPEF
ncbi:amino acid ABC transporter substrate-binding protein [Palleronia caenipelagi]|uniref:Amino acid ABC transporter substrate-binding protein n=1 Tax=Palleronia caenipelagi TaxID=2489174 RepID=A0A547PR96_9RHOB|nr:amino acid ABC transporter substrate-binding protein [Palleronia caenipelagi]TRD16672.1 amino acid ABC transporter substrate-binding protein [Palleronia caenipelagi]